MEAVTASYHLDNAKSETPGPAAEREAAKEEAGAAPAEASGDAPGPSPVAKPVPSEELAPKPAPKPASAAPSKPKPLPSQGPRLPDKKAPTQKKKVGTLHQDTKWRGYDAKVSSTSAATSAARRTSGLLKVVALSKVERMQAAVPVSRWLRLALVSLATLLFCMIKEGDRLVRSEEVGTVYLQNEQRMLTSCTGLLASANIFQASSMTAIPSMARACVDSSRVLMAIVLAGQPQCAWVAAVGRPVVYVGLTSLATATLVFIASYVFPGLLVNHVGDTNQGGNDAGAMMRKLMGMLPPKVLTALQSANLLRTLVNALFMDASCYLVIMMVYQLTQLL